VNALRLLTVLLLSLWLGGCAALLHADPPRVNLVGLEPLPGQGLELRMLVKLRVTNPNDSAIDYDGIALDMDVQGQAFASGVSDAKGSIPRFGEAVLTVPVTISAIAVLRQAAGLARGQPKQLTFALSGKLASASSMGAVRFRSEGDFKVPDGLAP